MKSTPSTEHSSVPFARSVSRSKPVLCSEARCCPRLSAYPCLLTFFFFSFSEISFFVSLLAFYLTGMTNLYVVSIGGNPRPPEPWNEVYIFSFDIYFTAIDCAKYVVHLILFISPSYDAEVRDSLLKCIISYCSFFFLLFFCLFIFLDFYGLS